MRILMSAYACAPGQGSEPEVGLRTLLAAASEHDVWLITRSANIGRLQQELSGDAFRQRVHLVGIDLGGLKRRWKPKAGLLSLHWYYDAWQREVARLAVRLDEEFDFDLVHHVTFSSYWTRVGAASVAKPLVWGPVGGACKPPLRLLSLMGWKGAITDLARIGLRPVVAYVHRARRTAEQSAVLMVQNPETATALRSRYSATILPNALAAAGSINGDPPVGVRARNVVVAGRLIGLKATSLALLVLDKLRNDGLVLDIFGTGPEIKRLQKLTKRLDIVERVRFHGVVPRSVLLEEFSKAGVFLHPALHDEAPLVVAEALSSGAPVVCLDRGGPKVLSSLWPDVPSVAVPATSRSRTSEELAAAIRHLLTLQLSPAMNLRPDIDFRTRLLELYDLATGP